MSGLSWERGLGEDGAPTESSVPATVSSRAKRWYGTTYRVLGGLHVEGAHSGNDEVGEQVGGEEQSSRRV